MDPSSPFFTHDTAPTLAPGRVIHVLYCDACHYVWKAPAASTTCVNCNQGPNVQTARSLLSYTTSVPIA